jgi:hypothetical protein
MTERQLYKYRAEWAKAWKALRALGRPACDNEKERKRWHLLIGAVYLRGPQTGQPKSSKVLTNAELDRFLKRCAAFSDPANLPRQIALDDQPLLRLRYATDPLFALLSMPEEKREAYLAGIYRNLQRPRVTKGERVYEVHEMPDADLQSVVIALTHTMQHKLRVDHAHPVSGAGTRAAWDHDVGARSKPAAPPLQARDNAPDPSYVAPEDGEPF